MPLVAIVILNWNGRPFLAEFLPTVLTYSGSCPVYVADNHSTDDSVAYVRAHYPAVTIIQHARNLGFCEGYNQALRQIAADYYVLLNSDVEVTPDWLTPLIALMEADPAVAACQPKIKSYHQREYFEYAGAGGGLLDRFGFPFCRGRLFQVMEKDIGQYNDTVPIFWATGACLLVRAAYFHGAGGLEPAFFAHMEEIDLCWRLQNQGYKIRYCGQSTVYHVGGGTLPAGNPRKTFLNFRNGLVLLYKNLPAAGFYRILLTRLFLDWLAAGRFLVAGQTAEARAVVRAHAAVWRNRKYWHRQRRAWAPTHETRLTGWYPGSIVWDFFIRRKKTYRELNSPKF